MTSSTDAPVAEAVLSPLAFLERSASVWRDRVAVRSGGRSWTYREMAERVGAAASALRRTLGVAGGDRVALLLPNVGAMLELHYAVPAARGVMVPLNIRLAAGDYAYILDHSGASVLFAGTEFRPVVEEALQQLEGPAPEVVWVDHERPEQCGYEALVSGSAPEPIARPDDERTLISINYTSGTTGRPKGVMTSHRGAYLHSLGVIAEARLTPRSVYLWTLPMFHCNGWAYTWAVTAMGAAHVCIPRPDPELTWQALLEEGVTHLCAAPTVLSMMLASEAARPCPRRVTLFVGGAPPSPTLLERAERLNIDITHLYGLTETYGPVAVCAWNPDWDDRPHDERVRLRARQGVGTVVSERMRVVDREMRDVPADGENIATIEVEQALCAHPAILEAAVIGVPDERWGEVPVAFVTARPGEHVDEQELREFARERMARFKVPKRVEVVDSLPKTGTGKIQKFLLRQREAERVR